MATSTEFLSDPTISLPQALRESLERARFPRMGWTGRFVGDFHSSLVGTHVDPRIDLSRTALEHINFVRDENGGVFRLPGQGLLGIHGYTFPAGELLRAFVAGSIEKLRGGKNIGKDEFVFRLPSSRDILTFRLPEGSNMNRPDNFDFQGTFAHCLRRWLEGNKLTEPAYPPQKVDETVKVLYAAIAADIDGAQTAPVGVAS